MNIAKIRANLEDYKGKIMHFKYNGARNQVEEFDGTIEDTYDAIFTIRLDEENSKIKAFTYSDILTEILQFFIK